MPLQTYTKKAERVVAQKFEGGAVNGNEIVNRVLNEGGTAVWLDAVDPIVVENEGVVFAGRPEGLRVMSPQHIATAGVGDYIVKIGDEFAVLKAADFEATYELA